jgi:sugar phosphate isomerase/epimerase
MRLSLQLYTVRDHLEKDPAATYKAISEIGLEYVEGGGSFGAATAQEGRKLLDDFGLKASGSHIGIDRLESELGKVIEEVNVLGAKYVIVPWLNPEVYAQGWHGVAKRIEAIGHKVNEAGLTLAYHNHDFEFKTEGKPGLDVLFEATDPQAVKFELDLAWVQIGGRDPALYIERFRDRLPLVHLKDFDPDKTPRWQPGGQGIVDWDACLDQLAKSNVEFAPIELDESAIDPIEAVRQSVEFFKTKGLE